jgi:2-phosphosulfolactate phosphatase
MIYDQSEYDVSCEWGAEGVQALAPVSDVVVIVDVLSFSTAVEIAVSRGAVIYPYAFRDETAKDFALSVGAEVADRDNPNGFNLSPASLKRLPPGARLVLPSPNGSTLSLLAKDKIVIAGCLRNARAVARFANAKSRKIAVIPAGERWEAGGGLRPSVEDLVGAGAIVSHLAGMLSPEARAAKFAYEGFSGDLFATLKDSVSGIEKLARGEAEDIFLAAQMDASACVPVRIEGAFKRAA